MKLQIDRTSKVLLSLVAVALWGILLRPLFTVSPAKAEMEVPSAAKIQSAADPLKPPLIFAAQEGIPYVVLSDETISVWYIDQKEKLDLKRKDVTARTIEENTRLFRVDSRPLPAR